jgi:flagellar hook-associated protein 3 FlgL
MRISTSQIYNSGLDSIQRQQAEMNRIQQQLASGKRILSPSDDPGGAVQSLQFRDSMARLEQYARNGGLATARLGQEEVVLGQALDGLQRVRELAIQGNNASQTPETRRAIASEIRQQLDQLYELANTRDANGEYIFAGFSSLDRPFVETPAGAVYTGGAEARQVAISDTRRIDLGDPGDAVFMGIPEGNGQFIAAEGAANTGTGSVRETTVSSPGAWDGTPRTLRFTAPDAWEAVDAANNVVASGSYADGDTITFEGLSVHLGGTPAAGDTFDVRASAGQDIFAIYASLADALEQPIAGPADTARQAGAIGRALSDLDQAVGRFSDVRSSIGARLAAVDAQSSQRENEFIELSRTLSEIEDLDYAEAISTFNLRMTGLQAAQQSYTMFTRMSLFDFLR